MAAGGNIEREVKFLDVDIPSLKERLADLGAEDRGEHLLSEVIFYKENEDGRGNELRNPRYVRIRKTGSLVHLTYKMMPKVPTIGVEEVEVTVDDAENAEALLVALGWNPSRRQEKKRHTFLLDEAAIEIDTWPGVPPYIEIEAPTEEQIKKAAADLGLDWNKKILLSAGNVLKDYYNISVWDLKTFTFEETK